MKIHSHSGDPGKQDETQIMTEDQAVVSRPHMYKLILLNDDYTPMEFVIWLLEMVFHKSSFDAERLMWQIHTEGSGVAGVYPHDVARTKLLQVKEYSKRDGHPLECLMEETD